MRLLVHDLTEEQLQKILLPRTEMRVIGDDRTIHHCTGCFGCWIKTPAQCVIRDKYGDMGKLPSQCDELILISKCYYGRFSPFLKNVLDRSIPYIHPVKKKRRLRSLAAQTPLLQSIVSNRK